MNTSDILYRAADLIEERGWTQGPRGWDATGSKLCLEGGILAATGQTFATVNLNEFWACPAYRAVMAYLGRDESLTANFDGHAPSPAEPLWHWNDHAEDAEQVIEVLRAAALVESAKENADVRESVSA